MPKVNSTRTVFVGIDPGASGGIAIMFPPCTGWPKVFSMPSTDRDVWDMIRNVRPDGGCLATAAVERNTGYIGGLGNTGSSMFKFGQGYGALRMALTAAGIPFEEPTPVQWQRGLQIAPRKQMESKGQFKNRLKAAAQRLFPDVKVTLATADAILIAEWCRRKNEGKL